MERERLEAAKKLEERIKRLKNLKMYIEDDIHRGIWLWPDFLRYFIPFGLRKRLIKNPKYEEDRSYMDYDKVFADDVVSCISWMVEKYEKELEKL